MKIAVMTGLPAKGNMEINACHPSKVRRFTGAKTRRYTGAIFRRYCGWLAGVLLLLPTITRAQYLLHVIPVDKDSAFIHNRLGVPTSFKSREACTGYVYSLLPFLQNKGYITASIDSAKYTDKAATIRLYLGATWKWASIDTRRVDPTLLAASAWNSKDFAGKPLDVRQYQYRQKLMLDYMENNGYPFAKVGLDSVMLRDSSDISATLKVDKGPLYKIDSIRVYGPAKISNEFLQRYLNISNGSLYRKDRLLAVDKKLMELPYIQEQQPWSITMLGDGSVLNLYLKPKKSSQIDALVGFLPSDNPALGNKVVVTGEATVNLQNALGNGETMSLDWQQLQQGSPRLDLLFQQPYIFNSPFGLNASFDLYKQDSEYLNVNLVVGAQYSLGPNQSGSVFLQEASSSLLDIDTATVIATHQLPEEADINALSLGLTYELNNTNYRFNPRRGNELSFLGSVGEKTVRPSSIIEQLTDPNDSAFNFSSLYDTVKLHSYEYLLKLSAAHYFPIGRATTLKLGFNGGIFSSPNTYRNELFMIGGYRLLRGFDEQSILCSQYAVGTLEYRYLVGLNSFLFTFVDGGWAMNNVPGYNLNNTYIGTGLGMAFETKAGIFNISYAIGRTNQTSFDFHDAKIHLGYVSFF
jgi:outer membrane protein assembly factor BamA